MHPTLGNTQESDQSFRLTRISELDAFLRKEAEERRKMQKKYQPAVNITQGVSSGAGIADLGMEAAGIALVAFGVGALPGVVLAALGASAHIVDLACGGITRKCASKAAKHAAVETTARAKLNSIHQNVSKGLSYGKISDEEFDLISDEVDRYHEMRDEIRAKARSPTDEAAKNEWMEQGREEIRAQFAKHTRPRSVLTELLVYFRPRGPSCYALC